MLEYEIKASSKVGGEAVAIVNNGSIYLDASSGRVEKLPNPAELLLTSLAACILKNVERFASILDYEYTEAKVAIKGIRNDSPPAMSIITYRLQIKSDMKEEKLQLLHKNILRYGTITNTLAKATELNGTIEFWNED
jgi:uncharacterized OsmC-like protein